MTHLHDLRESNVIAHMENIRSGIDENGFVLQDVLGNTSTGGFIYTIGLTEVNLPELRISNFHSNLGSFIIAEVSCLLHEQMAGQYASPQEASRFLIEDCGFEICLSENKRIRTLFGFSSPSVFVTDEPLGFANRYYGRKVAHVDIVTDGWPCPRCVLMDETNPCTCKFSCWWRGCDMLSQYQKSVSPDDYV